MHFSRYVFLATLAFGGPAFAADLAPQPVEPAAPVVSAYSWTGFYAGINGGYAFGSQHHVRMTETDSEDPTYSDTENYGSLSSKGGFGGIQAGYNQQYGGFVFGLEGDIQGAGISDKTTGVGPVYDYTLITKSQVNWFGTVRPRLGYAFDNLLIYATGGLAVGGVKYKEDYLDGSYTSYPSTSDTKIGYVLGAGVEYGITQNWSVKLEYQYVDLGRSSINGTEIVEGTPSSYTIHTKMSTDFHTVRIGLNYRF